MSFLDIDLTSVTGGLSHKVKGSRICLILEHPQVDELKTGKACLEGSQAAILGQCLGAADLTLSSVSALYIVPDRANIPPGFWTEKTGFTVDGSSRLLDLKQELEDLNPNILVPMGEMALQALTGRKGALKWRNSILEATLVPGKKCIPTLSPLMATRAYLYRYHIANDLRRVNTESYTTELNLPVRNLIVQPFFEEAIAFLDQISTTTNEEWKQKLIFDICKGSTPKGLQAFIDCKTGQPCGVDIEVYKGEVSCISFSPHSGLSMSIAIDQRWTIEQEAIIWRKIDKYLGDPTIPKIFQNGMFDVSFLWFKNSIITRGHLYDTMVLHNLNYPDFPKGLGFICSIYTREPFYKDDGKTWFNDLKSGKGDIDTFYRYNAKDSAVLQDALPEILKEIDRYGNTKTADFTRRLMQPLLYMAARGIRVNRTKLEDHKKDATKAQITAQAELDNLCGFSLNVASPKKCKEYFYETLGYKPITKLTKDKVTGARKSTPTTDNKAMKKLALRGCKEAKVVQTIRAYRKLIGTYLNIAFDSDDRLRCSWNISGTNTGRLSSSATIFGTGSNLQNLPKAFKAFLEADPGYLMCEMDKAQAEWVVVAYLCGDANMIRTIENREDAHINTAHLMFGAPKELLIYESEVLGSETDEELVRYKREKECKDILRYGPVANMSCRQAGKKSNHGLNYDLGINGFAATYGFTINEARRCHTLYHRAYPAIKVWHSHVRTQLGNDRTLTNLLGRKRRFLDRWGDDLFKAAYAYVPQSTVAQVLNEALVDSYEKQLDTGLEFLQQMELLSQVHDSALFQHRLDNLLSMARCIYMMKQFMEKPLIANGRKFVIRTDAKVGYNAKDLIAIDIEGDPDHITSELEKALIALTKMNQTPTVDMEELLAEAAEDEEEEG